MKRREAVKKRKEEGEEERDQQGAEGERPMNLVAVFLASKWRRRKRCRRLHPFREAVCLFDFLQYENGHVRRVRRSFEKSASPWDLEL